VNYIKKLEAESYDFRKRITLANSNIATHEVQAYLDRIGGILVDDPWYREETNEADPT
jgi:hypothetical protein